MALTKVNAPADLVSLECTCSRCGKNFWWRLSEAYSKDKCPDCREDGQAMAVLRNANELRVPEEALRALGTDHLYERIAGLLLKASEPLTLRKQTFWQAVSGQDPNLLARMERELARQQARELMADLANLIRLVREKIETRLVLIRAEVERRELMAKAAEIEQRGETRRLEEVQKRKALAEPAKPALSDYERMIEECRQEFDAKNAAEQAAITAFRQHIAEIFMSDMSDHEKSLRIRAVLRSYRFGREAVPKMVRQLLDRIDRENEQ
jgi:hypothetical protein